MANTNTRHNGKGRFVRTIEHVDQDREAAVLYQRFASYSEVGRLQGIETSTAFRRVQRALAGEPDDTLDIARKVALARLNSMAVLAREVADEIHVAHSNGRIVGLMDDDGNFVPICDRSVNLAAVDRLLRIEDQRARLLGTYAPTRVRVEVIPTDVIERMIRENERLIAKLERDLETDVTDAIDIAATDKALERGPEQTGPASATCWWTP